MVSSNVGYSPGTVDTKIFILIIDKIILSHFTPFFCFTSTHLHSNSHGLSYSFRHPLDVNVNTTYCILGRQVDFVPPSLKYSYKLHSKFGFNKPVIFMVSCVVYICIPAECISQTATKLYFVLYLVFDWSVLPYIYAHWSNIACLPAGRLNKNRDT